MEGRKLTELIECVPNFSEGRDPHCIAAIEMAISAVPGSVVLHRTSDPDHNRSVITFAGSRASVSESAVRAAAVAAQRIDLKRHSGAHPRLGALDVLPFVPLGRRTLAECVEIAHETGERIWRELHIPVYFYEAAALRPDRRKLEDVRRGQFEAIRDLVTRDPARRPDVGGPELHPTAGAVIVGARKILIAYNIDLRSSDVSIAKRIAASIRTSSGGFPNVKALGLALPSRGMVQVSMNLTDFETTPVHTLFAEVSRLAALQGVEIARSEVIGLLPRHALEMAAAAYLKLPDFDPESTVIENRIEAQSISPRNIAP